MPKTSSRSRSARVLRHAVPVKFRVRVWLDEVGKTQRWLAAQIGISTTYLTLILNGDKCPSLRLAKRLEHLTGVPAGEFCPEEATRGQGAA